MAIIGTFTRSADGTLTGNLRTLTLNTRLRFVPDTNKTKDSAPDFRIVLDSGDGASQTFEVGAAWRRTARESGRDYWSVRLNDPAFPAPLYASLVITEDDNTFHLLWSRRTGD